MVEMKNLLTGNIWLWERGKFVNRRYLMQVSIQTTAAVHIGFNLNSTAADTGI